LIHEAGKQLRAAIAEADRLDPHWRFDDLEAARASVPDERNAALAVLYVNRLLPTGWQAGLMRLDSPKRPLGSVAAAAAVRAELAKLAPAVAEARRLADLSEGRYSIDADVADGIAQPPRHQVLNVANLLAYDARRRAQDGDADGALASCRAALNAGRSVGDEPFLISQLVRQGCEHLAVGNAERVLAQTEPSDAALSQFQTLLEAEEAAPLLLVAFRGERNSVSRAVAAFRPGSPSIWQATGAAVPALDGSDPRSPNTVKVQRAAVIHFLNRLVEQAKLPPERQGPGLEQLKAGIKGDPEVVSALEVFVRYAVSFRGSQVSLRCAVAALAAERYRRDKGRWPDRLEELTEAGYLTRIPTDLYDGRPLRWRRQDAGAVAYSVGPGGRDYGSPTGKDPSFRLRDVAVRRPLPPEKEAASEDQVPRPGPAQGAGK
jgi:hypothetical protein